MSALERITAAMAMAVEPELAQEAAAELLRHDPQLAADIDVGQLMREVFTSIDVRQWLTEAVLKADTRRRGHA
jgi:hypothetical protein